MPSRLLGSPALRRLLVALVALVLAVAPGWGTATGEEETSLREKIREKFPALDQDAIAQKGWDARKRDAAGLAEDQAWLGRAHELLMKKWQTVQEARQAHRKITQAATIVTGYYTFVLLSVESEKRDRLERVTARESAEMQAQYAGKVLGEAEWNAAWRAWEASERGKAYDQERLGVETWFRGELATEIKRAQTGQSPLMDTLDEMTREAHDEMAQVSQAKRTVEREIERRARGVPEEKPEVPFEVSEGQRQALHFVPLRTEYEGDVGQPVETIFQVWRGRKPYLLYARAKGSTQTQLEYLRVREPGEVSVLFSFPRAGTYTAIVNATDMDGSDVKAQVQIVVKGGAKRKEGEKPPGKDGPAPPDAPDGPTPDAPALVPLVGTFDALLFGGDGGLPRPDQVPAKQKVTPVPLKVELDAGGRVKGRADYRLPGAAMGAPTKEGARNMVWSVAFTLEGQVDWATGRVHLDVRDGRAETGLEVDTPGYGLWRQSSRAEYTATLDGWAIPSPTAARWLGLRANDTQVGASFEASGRPDVAVRPDGLRAFQTRGFFGDMHGAGVPGVATPWAREVKKAVVKTGYVGKDESEEEQTRMGQMAATMAARMGATGWYLKILDAPLPEPLKEEPVAEAEPGVPERKGELWAFGLWPTRPVQARVGETVKARAMAVFSDDPFDAVDLGSRATWTASPGATVSASGEVRASAPGVYRVTATFVGPDGTPMTSTLMVAVAKE